MVVLQVKTHFADRPGEGDIRTVFHKGSVAKVKVLSSNTAMIDIGVSTRIVAICREELVRRFGELESLGKAYIDPQLVHYTVPFSQRSASKSIRMLSRGSEIPLEEGKDTVRFFIWWHDIDGNGGWNDRVDVDLSVVLFDDKWNYIDNVSGNCM